MPFIQQEPFSFFNIKFTDHGRKAAAAGNLSFDKVIISDREIDYSVGRGNNYNIFNNRILDVVDYYPDVDLKNYDGSSYFNTKQFNVTTEKVTLTSSTSSNTVTYVSLGNKGLSYTDNSANFGTTNITFQAGNYNPRVNDIVYVPWVSPAGLVGYNFDVLPSGVTFMVNTYKIISAITLVDFIVDRPIPNYTAGANPSLECQFYTDNFLENDIANFPQFDPQIWNLNIVRTNTIIGSNSIGSATVSGFTTYGSIEFNGAKHFFGFDDKTPIVGFVHYTNKYSGNSYGEQFIEGTFELNFPLVMWHHQKDAYYNNDLDLPFSSYNSSGNTLGLYLSDYFGGTEYDPLVKSTFRYLRDGRGAHSFIVGKVYHKLKLVVITDQELLTALTYKSNRNYTYPDFEVSLTSEPKYPLYPSGSTQGAYAIGLVDEGYDYFVTYLPEWSAYTANFSYGNSPSVPCSYIKKITGSTDSNGLPQYLKLRFPNADSFPYMRNRSGLTSYDTGWNANTVQVLVNIQPSGFNYEVGTVPFNEWKRVSNATLGGNGVYRSSDVGDNTIDPKKLNSFEFIISNEDYYSGSSYTINTGLTTHQNFLNYGDEFFVYGSVNTGILASVFKTSIQVYLDDSYLNGSKNPTFDPNLDTATYITEVVVLDKSNKVVAAGKPTYPILKSNIRWLTLQLDIDF